MVRTDPQKRKDAVLGMVVRHYIRTLTPVSSAYIADEYERDISSATIRNILAELEADGYLSHPHTSAGRVPTQRGYRYFVDFLMSEIELVEEERQRVQREYEHNIAQLETLLEKTTEIISDLTHCTSIVRLDGWDRKYVCRGMNYLLKSADVTEMHKIAEILRTLEEKEQILEMLDRDLDRRIKIYIGHETACSELEDCAVAVSPFETKAGESGRIAVLGPTRMDYQRVVSALEYVSEIIHEMV